MTVKIYFMFFIKSNKTCKTYYLNHRVIIQHLISNKYELIQTNFVLLLKPF